MYPSRNNSSALRRNCGRSDLRSLYRRPDLWDSRAEISEAGSERSSTISSLVSTISNDNLYPKDSVSQQGTAYSGEEAVWEPYDTEGLNLMRTFSRKSFSSEYSIHNSRPPSMSSSWGNIVEYFPAPNAGRENIMVEQDGNR